MVKTKKKISLKKFIEENTCPKMGCIIKLYEYFSKEVPVRCYKEKCHWWKKKDKKCRIDILVSELLEKFKQQLNK